MKHARDAKTVFWLYPFCVSLYQIILYVAGSIPRLNGHVDPFPLDPRMGLVLVGLMIQPDVQYPGVIGWASAVVLLSVAILLQRNASRIRIYVIAEALMAFPSLVMFLFVIAESLSPKHGGFSVIEQPTPFIVFTFCSGIPLFIALR